jgi:hypothetical protein
VRVLQKSDSFATIYTGFKTSGIKMNQEIRLFAMITLSALLILQSSASANEALLAKHQLFVRENEKKAQALSEYPGFCSKSSQKKAYKAGYSQALALSSTTDLPSTDPETPGMHPLVTKIVSAKDIEPKILQDVFNAVKEEFDPKSPLKDAMLCHAIILPEFDVKTGAPLRSHSDIRSDANCCIEGYKKGQKELIRALDEKPSPSELCVELYNAGIEEVKTHCKSIYCHKDISEEKARMSALMKTIYTAVPKALPDYLKSKFAFCFPENTTAELRSQYEHMFATLRSCFAWGRGAGMQKCAELKLQGREAQSTSASPVSEKTSQQGPQVGATPESSARSKPGASAK